MNGYSTITLLTIADIAARWSVSQADALRIVAAIPTITPVGQHEHELADGTALWTWSEVETAELAFPELVAGDGLNVIQKMEDLIKAIESLGGDPGDVPADIVYGMWKKASA
jgi:hypothetical protein